MGFKNYKYFLLLLIYAGACGMFIAATYWPEMYLVLKREEVIKNYFLEILDFLFVYLSCTCRIFPLSYAWILAPWIFYFSSMVQA